MKNVEGNLELIFAGVGKGMPWADSEKEILHSNSY